MMNSKVSFSVHSIIFIVLGFASICASAQNGVPFQLDAIQEQIIRIEDGVDRLGETVDEIASVDRALCDRPVSWNRKLPAAERFALALNGGAYCDLETGLVWMETPIEQLVSWQQANADCRTLEVDGRHGWQLPTVEQLLSLIDTQNASPALPLGHPFKGVMSDVYFTSSTDQTTVFGQYRGVWLVDLGGGGALTRDANPITGEAWAWCVRGRDTTLPIADVNLVGEEIDPNPNLPDLGD